MHDVRALNDLVAQESAFIDTLTAEVGKVIVGQSYMLERILIGLLTGGHVLLEGVPGLAKTLTVRTLCDSISAKFSRIQFTPDLLPADPIGTVILQPSEGRVHVQAWSGLREPGACRRNQPCAREGAERASRGNARATGDHRGPLIQAP